jgi:hypothetical protein
LLQIDVASPLAREVKMEIEQIHKTAWVTLRADSYEAVVSCDNIMQYPDSYLAMLTQLQLQEGSDAVRLNCDADEAKEIVAVLRQVGICCTARSTDLLQKQQQQQRACCSRCATPMLCIIVSRVTYTRHHSMHMSNICSCAALVW